MKLSALLKGVEYEIIGDPDTEICGVTYDSRAVCPGDLFFCIKGYTSDGHKYAPNAVAAGAACLIVTQKQDLPVTQVVVKDDRKAMALISAAFYGNPAHKLRMIGVTGTSGKTSTTYMLKSILECAGSKVGLIGTVYTQIGDKQIPAERTTPESPDLHKILAEMVSAGLDTVVMEVSSHSLYLDRVYGIPFAGGIFTNLSQDHLDFHGDFENYFLAKAILFENCNYAAINTQDAYGRRLVDMAAGKVSRFGLSEPADMRAEQVELRTDGSRFTLTSGDMRMPIDLGVPGEFMVYNALGAACICEMLGFDADTIRKGLEAVHYIPGRVENLDTRGGDYSIVLDYCHKPEALESVLKMLKGYAKGRVVCIFGCGGNRDAVKRPIMGEIAERLADFTIVTSDNPRFEEPMAIIEDITAGMHQENHTVVEDRREAIRYAIVNARPGDVILLAGKGHEDYQEIKGVHYPFDEKVVVGEILDELER